MESIIHCMTGFNNFNGYIPASPSKTTWLPRSFQTHCHCRFPGYYSLQIISISLSSFLNPVHIEQFSNALQLICCGTWVKATPPTKKRMTDACQHFRCIRYTTASSPETPKNFNGMELKLPFRFIGVQHFQNQCRDFSWTRLHNVLHLTHSLQMYNRKHIADKWSTECLIHTFRVLTLIWHINLCSSPFPYIRCPQPL